MTLISVTVSGSFHRHMEQIKDAVYSFKELGVRVLSPADPRVVDSIGQFLFVASDQHRSIRLVQNRHLASISQSDFLWLVAPDGYVGSSASLELGFAIAYGIPIFSETIPPDLTLKQYVIKVDSIENLIGNIQQAGSVEHLVDKVINHKKADAQDTLLVDPTSVIGIAHDKLEAIERLLHEPNSQKNISLELIEDIKDLKQLLFIPDL